MGFLRKEILAKIIGCVWDVCVGFVRDPPSALSFNHFRALVLKARRNINDPSQFVNNAIEVDNTRFATGDEWGEPIICGDVIR